MASWSEVEAEAPELAPLARSLFDAFKHKTLATLRRDGSPRISGIEIDIADEARKAEIGSDAPPGPFHLFRADITELVVVRVGEPADHLVIESWHAGRGVERRRR